MHITGPGGSGVTSLGRALAQHWAVPCHDTDDYFWQPTTPACQLKCDAAARLALMRQMFLPGPARALSGALETWSAEVEPYFDLVILLRLDPALRMKSLRTREVARYGAAALAPGGAMHAASREFMDWAALYDLPDTGRRSRARHLEWTAGLKCPVMELDSSAPVVALQQAVVG